MLCFDIYLRGFAPGHEPGAERLSRAFGIPLPRAHELVASLPRVVKREVPQAQIERYAQLLDAIGADCELRPSPIAPAHVIAVAGQAPAARGGEVGGDVMTLPPPPFNLLGPNDTLVEQHPAGSLVAPSEPAAIYVAGTGVPPDDGASQARVQAIPAPTPRISDTLSEAQVPPAPRSATLAGGDPWAPALPPRQALPLAGDDAVHAAFQPATDPSAPLVLPAAAPRIAAPVAPASIMPAPVAPVSIMPAPVAPVSSRPPPVVPQDMSYWTNAPTSQAPPSDLAAQLQVGWPADPLQPRLPQRADAHTSVAPPGVWQGSLRESSSRPPGAAYSTPVPPIAHEAALRESGWPSPGPSARPSARPVVASEPMELAGWQRWCLRLVLGIVVFVALGSLRRCRAFDDDIEQSLARWQTRPSESGDASATRGSPNAASGRAALGPLASEWIHSDLHQFAGGDKDRVRGLVKRFEAAGALSVHVGVISELGMTQLARELTVLLPTDPRQRAAVLEVHQAMLRATFGGLAPPSNPDGDVLHVTL